MLRSSTSAEPLRIRLLAQGSIRRDSDLLVDQLRAVKDPFEIERIRDAARLGSEVMEETIRLIRPGVAELEIASEIGYWMRRKGASGESFEAIVAAGPRQLGSE